MNSPNCCSAATSEPLLRYRLLVSVFRGQAGRQCQVQFPQGVVNLSHTQTGREAGAVAPLEQRRRLRTKLPRVLQCSRLLQLNRAAENFWFHNSKEYTFCSAATLRSTNLCESCGDRKEPWGCPDAFSHFSIASTCSSVSNYYWGPVFSHLPSRSHRSICAVSSLPKFAPSAIILPAPPSPQILQVRICAQRCGRLMCVRAQFQPQDSACFCAGRACRRTRL